jgi:hypothetical protein
MNHEHTTKWYNWKLGHRCPTCATNNSKVSYEFISKSFKQYDYTLLSKDYINARQKLDYKCSKGHPNSITWYNWKSGYRCPTCAGNTKLTIEYVKKSFEKDGYSLISTKYSGAHSKLNYICPIGHKHNTNWDCWNRGHRCKTCAIIKHTGSGHHQWKGGLSYEPYCEVWKDKEYKQDIRNRDGNRCLNPGCDSKNPNDLTIHHIDYNKKNCRPSNLITVCRSCNGIANKDRDWHTTWYQAIIKNRYYGGTKWR